MVVTGAAGGSFGSGLCCSKTLCFGSGGALGLGRDAVAQFADATLQARQCRRLFVGAFHQIQHALAFRQVAGGGALFDI